MDSMEEELGKIIEWCDQKATSYMEKDRKEKISDYMTIKKDLKQKRKKYKEKDGKVDVEKELEKIIEAYTLKGRTEIREDGVPLTQKASRCSVATKIRKNLRRSENG